MQIKAHGGGNFPPPKRPVGGGDRISNNLSSKHYFFVGNFEGGNILRAVLIRLAIPAEEYQRLYMGAVRDVLAHSEDGRRIRFPAMILRPYVTHSGVHGVFKILFDDSNRFQGIEKID